MPSKQTQKKPHIKKTPFVVLSLFIVILLAGIVTGEPKRVLDQAVQICLSCIGIG